jgi:hypothetical protein
METTERIEQEKQYQTLSPSCRRRVGDRGRKKKVRCKMERLKGPSAGGVLTGATAMAAPILPPGAISFGGGGADGRGHVQLTTRTQGGQQMTTGKRLA